MSFRIDLSPKEGIYIYLVVINDQINVNFDTSEPSKQQLAAEMRGRFTHLLSAHALLEHTQQMVRGEDAEHVKRHHCIKEETQVMHAHYSFDQDVTPELLKHFFDQLLLAQKSPNHLNDNFVSEGEATTIVASFTSFYGSYKGSQLENDFLKERELTQQEKDSLVKHAKQEATSQLSKRDVSELERCGFASSDIPKPSPRAQGSISRVDLALLAHIFGLVSQSSPSLFSGTSPGFFQAPKPDKKPTVKGDDNSIFSNNFNSKM